MYLTTAAYNKTLKCDLMAAWLPVAIFCLLIWLLKRPYSMYSKGKHPVTVLSLLQISSCERVKRKNVSNKTLDMTESIQILRNRFDICELYFELLSFWSAMSYYFNAWSKWHKYIQSFFWKLLLLLEKTNRQKDLHPGPFIKHSGL